MYSKVTFKKAEPTDAPLLAATRQKAWAATYRGIYPDEMIDQYDLERTQPRTGRDYRIPSGRPICSWTGRHV